MKTTHADDRSIQQFIFDVDNCNNEIKAHIKSCDLCLEVANGYQSLAIDLKAQEYPVLDLNIEDVILELLTNPKEQEQARKAYSFAGPLIVIAIGIIALLANSLIGDLTYWIAPNKQTTYFIACVGLFIATLLCIDVVRIYKSKMNKMNFS